MAELLIAQKIPVCNADAVDKVLLREDLEVISAITERYPDAIHEGHVQPHILAEKIFVDQEAVMWIEQLLHPRILKYMVDWTAKCVNRYPIVCWEVPLLFEAKWDQYCDHNMLVLTPHAIRKKRAMTRPYMTEEQFEHIANLQMPDSEKMKRADSIIFNHTNKAYCYHQLNRILATLRLHDHSYAPTMQSL